MTNQRTVRTMAVVALSAGLLAGASALAAPAQADTTGDSFLSALNSAGVGYNDPGIAQSLGQSVCPMLKEPGSNFASVASKMRGNNGISSDMAGLFAGLAIQMYCPQMMSSIANGDILNQLSVLGGSSNQTGLGSFIGPSLLGGLSIPGLS